PRPPPLSAVAVIFLVTYNFDWSVVTDRWRLFVEGAWVDLWVASIGFALACALGLLNALLRTSGLPVFEVLSFLYVQVMRGVPLYVLLLWVYFGVAIISGITFWSFRAIIIAIAFTGSEYSNESFRSWLGV